MTSSSSNILNFLNTAFLIFWEKLKISFPVAFPWFTIIKAWALCVPVLPSFFPLKPHFSINQAAGTLTLTAETLKKGTSLWVSFNFLKSTIEMIGFLKKLPQLPIILGSGNLLGIQVIPDSFYEMGYENNGMMLLSPMALITVGLIIWVQRSRNRKLIEKA